MVAVEGGEPGVYKIVDDEPAAVSEGLPVYAQALGAPEPLQAPPPRSPFGVHGMLLARGASNAKAKERLRWVPHHASWREGFAADIA